MNKYGYYRVACMTPKVDIANPFANAKRITRMCNENKDSQIIATPELSISAYSAMKLFHQRPLLQDCARAVTEMMHEIPPHQLVAVGVPVRVKNGLYNCVAMLNNKQVIGMIPKEFVPNYNEFEEGQWFSDAREDEIPETINFNGFEVPFGTQLIFEGDSPVANEVLPRVFVEVCEAIWMTIPPSSFGAIAGANIILNASTSTETVAKQGHRRHHVLSQSGRCVAAYAYCSSGPTESTNDVVCGGHNMIAECGSMLAESRRIGDRVSRDDYVITADVDLEKIENDRITQTSYAEQEKYLKSKGEYRIIKFRTQDQTAKTQRVISAKPFVPKEGPSLAQRCNEIFDIQSCALAKRLECLGPNPKLSIGVSGGLDSTLSFLVALRAMKMANVPTECLYAITMPGFGTTSRTLENAKTLMNNLPVHSYEIDIREACFEEFKEHNRLQGYKPFGIDISLMSLPEFLEALKDLPDDAKDLKFENIQARQRTKILMEYGFVLGTGDMSEIFQGWCTYNGDQQSMYNVNASIPKTLVRFLVDYIAEKEYDSPDRVIYTALKDICKTKISPELLPAQNDEIVQDTEESIGPYELIDFLMFHMIRNGYTPEKILYMQDFAVGWDKEYSLEERKKWMKIHITRFFQQQFKRENVPNGPKVGSVSLSPRAGNWRMPCEASPESWIRSIDNYHGVQ